MPEDLVDGKSTLVQVMAWQQARTCPRSMASYGVTRSHGVKLTTTPPPPPTSPPPPPPPLGMCLVCVYT